MVEVKDIANMISGALTEIVNAEVEKAKVNIDSDAVVEYLKTCEDSTVIDILCNAGKENLARGELNAVKIENYLADHRSEIKDVLDFFADLDKDDIPDSVVEDIQSDAVDEWFEIASGQDIYDKMCTSEYRELIYAILDANL